MRRSDRHVADAAATPPPPGRRRGLRRSAYHRTTHSRATTKTPTATITQPSHHTCAGGSRTGRWRRPRATSAPTRRPSPTFSTVDSRSPDPEVAEPLGRVGEGRAEAPFGDRLATGVRRELQRAADDRHRVRQVDPRELPEPPRRTSAWTVRMALRMMARKVSVSRAASMPASNAGRKLIACWLPRRTSSSVSRAATSLRTAWNRAPTSPAGRTSSCRRRWRGTTAPSPPTNSRTPESTSSTGHEGTAHAQPPSRRARGRVSPVDTAPSSHTTAAAHPGARSIHHRRRGRDLRSTRSVTKGAWNDRHRSPRGEPQARRRHPRPVAGLHQWRAADPRRDPVPDPPQRRRDPCPLQHHRGVDHRRRGHRHRPHHVDRGHELRPRVAPGDVPGRCGGAAQPRLVDRLHLPAPGPRRRRPDQHRDLGGHLLPGRPRPARRATTSSGTGTRSPCGNMAVMAFPGHAGRRWPLARWRSLARISEWAHR